MLHETHLEIAKERFLELMASNPERDARSAAVNAIKQADEFDIAYRQFSTLLEVPSVPEKRLKGCKDCFGSGGKRGQPCKACGGTGKVPV